MSKKSVMVLDDEPIVGDRLKPVLEREGFEVETFTESEAALQRLKEKSFDVLVTDMKMRGPTGMDVLRYVKDSAPATQVIVITGYATIETNREAEALGAYQFIAKPFKMAELAKLVSQAAKERG
ncbi:MAG: response regulator [Acidobacteria bacterium]|jgi:DNA-binding NtrC family response regulator|nr:response regulator [Acidobacteriota bacterium]